ncbi:hypothetical protein NQ315_012798 [Exocentrus adspersus]|uniref:CCHC-type domain-containing protein n=1 Tax=Exocentrus adspersus TaxID=1586481 RepID=A0AAV8VBA9_9CUCU|nr:hypothetical protein NQ315_012798 [Exocentrus adspersus]
MSGEEVMELGLGDDDLLDREEASSGHATMRTSPRRGDAPLAGASRDQAATPSSVEDLARALLAGSSLTADIRKITRQQAALVVGDVAEVPASRRPEISEMEASGLGRRSLLLGHDVVDKFDPADPDSSIERWLQKIDQLGVVHGWTNYERATLAQAKLTGAARRWFFQLEDYDLTWEQWKAKLRAAFPRRREFANMLEELVNRRKQPAESITSYYHDKLALCDRVRITGADAVSCIVSGLPADLRTNAQAARCGTPDELYNSFLAGLESYRGGGSSRTVASRVQVPRREPEAQRRSMVADRVLKRCFNCQKRTDHVSRDCPQPAVDRCRACGEGGHWARECPKRRSYGQGDGQATVATRGVSSTSAQQACSFYKWGFYKKRVKAYLDTGSEQNLMAADVARRLGLTVREDGEIQALRGFGGGVVYSLGEVVCDMMLADCRIAIKALITAADLGPIELLLGLPTINGPGVTMVVRGGKTYLTTEPDMEELFRRINLEPDGRRPKVVLAEDVTIVPDAITSAKVEVIEGVPGVRYCMSRKEFPCGRSHIVIPAGILSGVDDFVKVMNVGADQIQWKRGRLVSRVQACQGSQETRLAISELDISGVIVGDVSERCKESLFELLRRKSCCFSKGDGDLGLTHLGQMQLRLTTEVPVYHRPYGLSFRERELEAGAIDLGRGAGTADSQSPQASRTEKGGAVDTPTGTNSEQQGDDFAYAPPPAGNPRRKRPRRIPGVTRRSARLLRRQVTTEGCRAQGDVEGGVLSTVLLYGDEQTAAGTSVPGEATHHTALSDGKAQPRDFDSKVLRDRIRAMDRIGRAARKMKSRYDRRRKVAASYKAGELVLWRDAAAQKAGMEISHKLANKFDGPYQVCKVLPNDRYIIGAIKGVRGYKRFTALVAVDSLRRYHSVNEVDYDSNPDSDSGESNPGGQPLAN